MSNELFDKKLKDRLNSLNKPVSPNVWNNIEKQLVIPWYYDFWRRYALSTYSVLSTLFILFCLKEIFQNREQLNLLNDKISTIKQINAVPEIKTIVHKDTIYVQKTIYIVEKSSKNEAFKQDVRSLPVPNNVQKADISESEKIVSNTDIKANEGINNSPNQNLPNDNSDTNQSKKEIALSTEDAKTPDIPNEYKKDSIAKSNIEKPAASSVLPTSGKKTFHWPKFDTRFGISSAVSLAGDVNLGPVVEFMLKPNLGFSLGLAINRYPNIEYASDKQFNLFTGQNFVDLYRSKIPEKYDALTEININTSILELPIYLNYYVPLKRKLDLKFTFGTHIDLKLYQNIRFETYNNGEETYTEFNTLASENSWHNMILGIGLQYKLKNVAVQLSPTYLYNYREVDYIKSGGAFRINGGVLLNIGNR